MAWGETCIMEKRYEFVLRALQKKQAFAVLCREYDISAKNGRKWVKRFRAEGESGLVDRPRKPKSNCRSPDSEIVMEIIKIRVQTRWGCGINIEPILLGRYPQERVPAPRTIDRILKESGLVEVKKRRRVKPSLKPNVRATAEEPNDIWTIDYKGWWRTRDMKRVEPLTVRDDFSKYLVCVQGMRHIRWEAVKETLTDTFTTYGLPRAIRSDNGSPFAHAGSLAGLTQLSAWWLALGIKLDRIDPGRPSQNGGHERMHRDLKRQVQRFPAADLALQQGAFDEWKNHFNTTRPHKALGLIPPAKVYRTSPRALPCGELEIVYPNQFEIRKVSSAGDIKRNQKRLFLSRALAGWTVGLEEEGDGMVRVWFADLLLGRTDRNLLSKITPG